MSKKFDYEDLYDEYWDKDVVKAHELSYYDKIYGEIKYHLKYGKKGAKILDVGGGNGGFLLYMGYKHATIIDISSTGLKFAKDKVDYKTIKTNILTRFPLEENTFDCAYCLEVLEHLEYPNKVFSEINNVLKANGVLYISIPNFKPDGIFHKRRWKQKELEDDLKKSGYAIIWIKNTPRFNLSIKDIKKTNTNFLIKSFMIIFHVLLFRKLRFALCRLFPNVFTATRIVKSKKVL